MTGAADADWAAGADWFAEDADSVADAGGLLPDALCSWCCCDAIWVGFLVSGVIAGLPQAWAFAVFAPVWAESV